VTAPGRPEGPLLVHGTGKELVPPDWPPLEDAEAQAVLAACFGRDAAAARVAWRSPRPLSAAGLVEVAGRLVFLKRHHLRVRTPRQLLAEHALARHLAGRAQAAHLPIGVPAVLAPPLRRGPWAYEVHAQARGFDLYRDEPSWSPFHSLGHAWAAGAALARFHLATAGFGAPERPFGVLVGSCALVRVPEPLPVLAAWARQRPGLARALAPYPWEDDFERHVLPAARLAAAALAPLEPAWAHCDWHPSNLTWASEAPGAQVVQVIDLGLANRTYAAHDLATAIERSAVPWLDLSPGPAPGAATGPAPGPRTGLGTSPAVEADLDVVDALVDGYESVRPLAPAEHQALVAVLPVAHVEYALSELEYYADVVGSAANADAAYHTYLLGHLAWFAGPDGQVLLAHLHRRAARPSR